MTIKKKCGIFAIYDNKDCYDNMINGLKLLQHRGQDSAGISYISASSSEIKIKKNIGLVKEVFNNFNPNEIIYQSIGHVRYSTCRKTSLENQIKETQPLYGKSNIGKFTLAHNGNIPNTEKLKIKYEIKDEIKDEIESDTIILLKIIEKLSKKFNNWNDIFIDIINKIEGTYCLLIQTFNNIYIIRDSHGIRPLCIGKRENGGYCISSESIALQEYKLIRNVMPGEIIELSNNEIKTIYKKNIKNTKFCSFEYIYFMRSKSITNNNINNNIEKMRYESGYEMGLNEEKIEENSIVLCAPNTGIPAAKGFAKATNLIYYDYIEKKKDTNRTFILPTNEDRIKACDNKYIYDIKMKNKIIYIIDDSIVRGNTLKSIINKINEIGVKKIHLRITSPPVISPCYFGIDIPTNRELIAYNKSVNEVRKHFGATTLKYMDIKLMKKIFNEPICTSCFDGKYDKKLLDW